MFWVMVSIHLVLFVSLIGSLPVASFVRSRVKLSAVECMLYGSKCVSVAPMSVASDCTCWNVTCSSNVSAHSLFDSVSMIVKQKSTVGPSSVEVSHVRLPVSICLIVEYATYVL